MSILQRKRLRLSTIRTSNDPLEVNYGIDLARRSVRGRKKRDDFDRVYKDIVLMALRGELPDGTEKRLPSPHVCCFSTAESETKIEHWALYGRGGSGFGLVFDGPALSSRVMPISFRSSTNRAGNAR